MCDKRTVLLILSLIGLGILLLILHVAKERSKIEQKQQLYNEVMESVNGVSKGTMDFLDKLKQKQHDVELKKQLNYDELLKKLQSRQYVTSRGELDPDPHQSLRLE